MCRDQKGTGFPELEWAIIWIHEIKSSPLRNKVLFTVDQFLQACIKLLIGKDLQLTLCQLFSICLAVLLFLLVLFLSPLKTKGFDQVPFPFSLFLLLLGFGGSVVTMSFKNTVVLSYILVFIHVYWFINTLSKQARETQRISYNSSLVREVPEEAMLKNLKRKSCGFPSPSPLVCMQWSLHKDQND